MTKGSLTYLEKKKKKKERFPFHRCKSNFKDIILEEDEIIPNSSAEFPPLYSLSPRVLELPLGMSSLDS